jgi:hypothetical protein
VKENFYLCNHGRGGVKWETSETVGMAFANYFSDIFTTGPVEDVKLCTGHIALEVTGEMNVELLKGFTNEEVEVAISQMVAFKALALGGFTA